MTKTLAILAAVALTGASHAAIIQYSDLDSYGTSVLLTAAGPAFTGNFNITTDDADGITDHVGYVPGSGLLFATAGFTITAKDGGLGPRTYTYQLQGDAIATPGVAGIFDLTMAPNEQAIGTAFLILTASGQLTYTIDLTGGADAYLTSATLTAFQDKTRVPDGGATAMLIGAGILGLGALRRKVS